MKLSARSRYAARILLELAKHGANKPLSAAVLSKYTGVSVQFVEQILKPLKHKGYTHSVRGAFGGHRLLKDPSSITLGEIVRLMEGGVQLTLCVGDKAKKCPRKASCLTRQAWLRVSNTLQAELDAITIASLLNGGTICEPQEMFEEDDLEIQPVAAEAEPPRAATVRKVKGLRPRAIRG